MISSRRGDWSSAQNLILMAILILVLVIIVVSQGRQGSGLFGDIARLFS